MSVVQRRPAPLGPAQAELAPQRRVRRRHRGDRAPLGLGERDDIVVKAGDRDAAILVLHRGEKAGKHHRRIGRPIAVMAAVQRPHRAIDGKLEIDVAAHAERDLGRAGLVGGAVDDDPAVGAEQRAVAAQQGGEVGEPASSSPSKTSLRLKAGRPPSARSASTADRIAMTPALSSDVLRP